MKTKLFHAGRSTLSVVLAVMMLLSTMLMGSLSTVTAANVGDGEVGAAWNGGDYSLIGTLTSNDGSSWANTDNFSTVETSGTTRTGTLTLTLSEGDYSFKLYDDTTNDNHYWSTSSASSITRSSNTVDEINTNGGTGNDMSITADVEGSYIFTLYITNDESSSVTNRKLVVTYPDSSSGGSSSSAPHIYLADSAGWGSAYAYAWNGSTYYNGNWPGSAMTLDSTYTASKGVSVYAYELDSSATGNIIFVQKDKGSQTADLTLPSDWTTTDYIYDNSTGEWSTLADYEYTATTTYDYYIIGSDFGGKWTTDYKTYGMTKSSDTDYYISAYLTQNSSYFRFHDGTKYWGAEDDDTEISTDSLQVDGNSTYSWKFTGTTGQYEIHFGGADNKWVWLVADDTTISGDIFMTSNVTSFNDATAIGATATKNDDGTITYTKTYSVGTSGDLQAGEYLFGFTATGDLTNLYGDGTIDHSGQISGDIDVNSQYAKLSDRDTDPMGMKVTLSDDATLLTVTVTKATDGSITYYATGEAKTSAKLIAKNGTIRTSGGNYDSITDDMGTTTVTYDTAYIDDGDVTITDGTARKVVKMTADAIKKGLTLTITTTMTDSYSGKYYVAGWVVNGETYGLQESAIKAGGEGAKTTVSFDYTVPVDTATDSVIEVTPVYYMVSDSTVRFYVEDYENVKAAWGNTLACYAYYSTGETDSASFNQANGFGCYPGQPMLKIGGRYFYDLPSSVNGKTIKGVTLNNYMWDDVHKSLVGSTNYQTYDYSDFGTIYNQKIATLSSTATKPDIIFAFKYTSEAAGVDNFDGGTVANKASSNVPTSTSNLNNVTENLTDFYGKRVDLFHKNIENSTTVSNTPWIAISNGYEDCNDSGVGYYATRWAIYKPTDSGYEYVTAINSASLFYSSADDLTNAGYTTEADAYTTLLNEGAANQPVVISYEKEITRAKSLENTSADGDQTGARSDGVWYYSIADITVTAHTAVQYATEYKSTGYSDSDYMNDYYLSTTTTGWDYENATYDPDSTEYYKGHTTGLEAYFNFSDDDGTNFWHKTAATLSTESTKKFVFNAQPKTYNGKTYQFDGWYLYNASSDTYTLISTQQNYYTDPVNNDLYVARFSPVPTEGALTVNHYFDSANSTGTAEVNVKVEVIDTNNSVQYTNSGTNTATVPQSTGWINNLSENNVVITLTTTPGTGVTFEEFEELVGSTIKSLGTSGDLVVTENSTVSSTTYDSTAGTYTATIKFPVTSLFNDSTQKISSLTYYSKTSVDFKLQIDYKYDTRYYDTKVYQVISDNYYTSVNSAAEAVTLNSDFISKYIVSDGNDGYKVTTGCITDYAPDVTNFNQDITWDVSGAKQSYDSTTGLIKVELKATQAKDYVRYATIKYVDPDTSNETTVQNVESTYQYNDTQDASTADYHWYKSGTTFYETAANDSKGNEFSYWAVYKLSDYTSDNSIDGNSVVTYIYDRYFNYTAFDNYYVVAVYGSTDTAATTTSATVVELADTRNHWNNTTTGESDSSILYNTAQKEYDRLYIDFALSYKIFDSNGEEVILNPDGEDNADDDNTTYKVGFVIAGESVDKSDVESTVTKGDSIKAKTIYVEIDNGKLTNKNRIEYCYGVKNTETNTGKKLKVYAFVYDGTSVILSDEITVCYSKCLDSANTAYQTTNS